MKSRFIRTMLSIICLLAMILNMPTAAFAAEASSDTDSRSKHIYVGDVVVLKARSSFLSKSTWASSDTAVATVNKSGSVKGITAGTAAITATTKIFLSAKPIVETWTITVAERIADYEVRVGETLSLTATAPGRTTWASIDKKIATIDKKGVVTGVSEGYARITAVTVQNRDSSKLWNILANIFAPKKTVDHFTVRVVAAASEPDEPDVPDVPDEPDEPDEPEGLPKPDNPSEADEYYWDNSIVIEVEMATESDDVLSEAEAKAFLEERGFGSYPIEYDSSMSGEYLGENEVSVDSNVEHPMYTTFFVSSSGDIWTIYIIDRSIYAYPVSFNIESPLSAEVMVSETETIISYDSAMNKFYVTIPFTTTTFTKVVSRIDADTLNSLTTEVLSES